MTTRNRKIETFATTNDTASWVVCVDGYFGLFADRAEAAKVYAMTGGLDDEDGCAGTPFGSCVLLPPGHLAINRIDGSWLGDGNISDAAPIDIADYIRKSWLRSRRAVVVNTSTPADRLWFDRLFRGCERAA